MAFSGGFAGKTAIEGAIMFVKTRSETLAAIEDRAVVTAGNDVDVEGTSHVNTVSIAPALAIGTSGKGVGIGVAISVIDDKTRALIGDANDAVQPGGYGGTVGAVTAGHDVNVHALSAPHAWSVRGLGRHRHRRQRQAPARRPAPTTAPARTARSTPTAAGPAAAFGPRRVGLRQLQLGGRGGRCLHSRRHHRDGEQQKLT